MKKRIVASLLLVLAAFVLSAFTTRSEQNVVLLYYTIDDVSGLTNIRNKPNGSVCMKLKAWTDYQIYTNGKHGSWLRIQKIYNATEDYWVRLHSSSTKTYWISRTILSPYYVEVY